MLYYPKNHLPPSVNTCLYQNTELWTLASKYGITPTTDVDEFIRMKAAVYVTQHFLTFHKWMGSLNTQWKAQLFYQFGYDVATDSHAIWSPTASLESVFEDFSKMIRSNLRNE